jgi:radical SAM protein with 4Fe4S-binding SPASM domain
MGKKRSLPKVEYKDFSGRIHELANQSHRVIKAQLELTYRCNLHCTHCYTDPYNTSEYFPREWSTEDMLRVIDEMADLGIIWMNLTGGEIFMHPRFFEIYEYAYRKGFLLMLYTNGTLFTAAMLERLKQCPPFSIDISCHSVHEEPFDRFTRVPGSFRAFMRGMNLLKDSGLPFCFKTLGMTWNKQELPDIRRFIESFGQPFRCTTDVKPRLNGDCTSLTHRLSPDEIVALEGRAPVTEPMDQHEDAGCLSGQSDALYQCGCGTTTIHINAWGELGTCTMQYEHRVSLHTSSLIDAINDVFAAVRTRRYEASAPCRRCELRPFCDTTPSDARRASGSAGAPVPYYCDVALARAERARHQPLLHPLSASRARQKETLHA